MTVRSRPRLALSIAVLALLPLGCDDGQVVAKDTAPVRGKLLLRGQPYKANTLIVFVDSKIGRSFETRVDSAGGFRFEDPLPIGTYTAFLVPLGDPEVIDAQPLVRDAKVPVEFYDEGQSTLVARVPTPEGGVILDMR